MVEDKLKIIIISNAIKRVSVIDIFKFNTFSLLYSFEGLVNIKSVFNYIKSLNNNENVLSPNNKESDKANRAFINCCLPDNQ